MPVGRGTEDDVKVGPLIDATSARRSPSSSRTRRRRARRSCSAARSATAQGYFYDPTVLAGVPADARLLKEEIFGPVAPVASFDDEEAAVAAANDTEYGLVAYVYTNDIKRAFRVFEGLETGMVGLNQGLVSNPAAPFGGVKQSGFGREGGAEGIQEYLEIKYVAMNLVTDPLAARARAGREALAAERRRRPTRWRSRPPSPEGRPSVRFVLVRGIDEHGARFYTNYGSRKGRELDANPRAALAIFWQPLGRQVRMEGTVERLTRGVRRVLRLARTRLAGSARGRRGRAP